MRSSVRCTRPSNRRGSIEGRAALVGLDSHHAAMVSLYNFGRVHQTLRVTPAMEAGISKHVWSFEEIVGLLV